MDSQSHLHENKDCPTDDEVNEKKSTSSLAIATDDPIKSTSNEQASNSAIIYNTFNTEASSPDTNIRLHSKLSTISILQTCTSNTDFLISSFISILCIFLGIVCILYGLGQITDLQLNNYWCEKKDLQTIYQHSLENNLNEGTTEGCWKSKLFTV